MADIKVRLLKPLDGLHIGAETTFSEVDVKRLERLGAVKRLQAPENKKAPTPKNKSTGGSTPPEA